MNYHLLEIIRSNIKCIFRKAYWFFTAFLHEWLPALYSSHPLASGISVTSWGVTEWAEHQSWGSSSWGVGYSLHRDYCARQLAFSAQPPHWGGDSSQAGQQHHHPLQRPQGEWRLHRWAPDYENVSLEKDNGIGCLCSEWGHKSPLENDGVSI